MITSTGNAKIRNIVQLKKKAKERDAQGVFLAEGIRMFQEVRQEVAAEDLLEVYVSESFLRRPENRRLLSGVDYESVADQVFAYMSDTQTPQGVICVVKQFHYTVKQLLAGDRRISGAKKAEPLCMILENLQDPGNLGTILRTAEGAGVTGILLNEGCVDIYNPKVIRSTMGSILRMPFCYTANLRETLVQWKNSGVKLYAAHLKGKGSYTACDYRQASAFMIGNEGNGLSDEIVSMADTLIRIPMKGKVESLNASVAASVLMYEALRQREM